MDDIQCTVARNFNIHGLTLEEVGLVYLERVITRLPSEEQELLLKKVIDRVRRLHLDAGVVRRNHIMETLASVRGIRDPEEFGLYLINAHDVPKLIYDADIRKFIPDVTELMYDSPDARHYALNNRYELVLQRTLHHQLFSPDLAGTGNDAGEKKYILETIKYLCGCTATQDVIVLGMLSQLKEEKYYLEDPTGYVELDLSQTVFQEGYYSEGSFVIAQGNFKNQRFHVKQLGPPPAEEASITRTYYGSTNFFGNKLNVNLEAMRMLEIEQESYLFTIISDLYLDKTLTFINLERLFEGYDIFTHGVFIFMGNFLSNPFGPNRVTALLKGFDRLSDLILDHPRIAENFTFIIVPGPLDPGYPNILPRSCFPDAIIDDFREKLPRTIFGTNPFRIKYCTKEIVVFREDVMSRLMRTSVHHPASNKYSTMLVEAIVGQSHLAPFTADVCPVYWCYDHALSIYPLPDLVVIADNSEPFKLERDGCHFVNPGSFLNYNFTFYSYSPFKNEVEVCSVPQGSR